MWCCRPNSCRDLVSVQLACDAYNVGYLGEEKLLQRRTVRHGSIRCSDAANRTIEVFESLFRNDSSQFACKSSDLRIFMEKNDLIGLPYRIKHSFFVKRQKRTQIENFQVDSFFFEFLRGVERDVDHGAVR